MVFVKDSPEQVLSMCAGQEHSSIRALEDSAMRMASRGYLVPGLTLLFLALTIFPAMELHKWFWARRQRMRRQVELR